ncbi:MAG: cytochrome c biogenesis CcdA family protein [Xanthobacteraceae bacterium]
MDLVNISLALAAGVLSILSPCVLPLVPIVLGTAVAEHRFGPVALAAGMAVSFTAIGLFVATIGYSIELDGEVFRQVGAVLLIAIGAVLVMPRWQARVALAAGPVSAWTERKFDRASHGGLARQFGVGAMLGAVWSPCVGPTLGTASALAARGRDLGQAALMMLMFGLGSALPLLLLGMLSREAQMRWRGRLLLAGKSGKAALGLVLIAGGMLVLLNLDKAFEAWLINTVPQYVAYFGWL